VTAITLLVSGSGFGLAADVAAGPGIFSGAIWNLGNICSVVAVQDPGVGLAIAYPIMQCGLFVAGLWGIFLHKELQV
jgi:glucose uptake protein GlcU